MKRSLLVFLFIFSTITAHSQNLPSECWIDTSQFEYSSHSYLDNSFGTTKRIKVAIIYVDFPDGRINGTIQPYFDYQLAQLNDTDAAAEVGVKIIGSDTIPVCAKYTYFDRWNMYFDSLGNYFSTAHPDWDVFKDSAWGSFKEYWLETSNNKVVIEPAMIRSNSVGDSRFNSGIINNYSEILPGRFIIKSVG